MEFETYVRKPFMVQALEVTLDNIEELAPLIGTLKKNAMGPFIFVNRKLVPNVDRVYPGYWVTRMGDDNLRCYSSKTFRKQFMKQEESSGQREGANAGR